ncbi:MAG: glycosyltransferase family 9 protein [Bacteroidota bacterium]
MTIKYLIVRFSSIGDIVLTTPAIRCLKEQVEGAEVHYLTKPQYAHMVENNPHVDKVHVLKSSFRETLKELRAENFDYLIDLHRNLRTNRIKRRLKVLDFSFNKLNREKWLMVNFKRNKLPDKHIVDRYMETLSVFDVRYDGKGLDYFIPVDSHVDIHTALPESHRQGYLGFVIGGQHATKMLPAESIAEICKRSELPVVLLGGPEDTDRAEKISKACPKAFNACGIFSLNQSASLVKQARLIITHDTGLMHIAAAFHKPVLSVWGNTIPEFGMYPFEAGENSQIFEVKDLKCRPCSKIGYNKCPKRHFDCMMKQNLTGIAESAKRIFQQNRPT